MTALRRISNLTIAPQRSRQLLDLFLAKREVAGVSRVTLRNYEDTCGRFLAFPGTPAEPANWTDEHVDLWVASLWKSGLKAVTVAYHQRHLFVFLGWLHDREVLDRDIRRRVERVKVPTTRGRSIDHETFLAMVLAASVRRNARRDMAILHALWSTGLRRSELAMVDLADTELRFGRNSTDPIGPHIRVRHSKTKVERIAPLSTAAAAAILEYVTDVRGAEPGPLFLGQRGGRMATDAMRLMLARCAAAAGVDCSAHDFRRGFAARMRRNGLDIGHVKRLLGHSTITMSLRYSEEGEDEAAIEAYRAAAEKVRS